MNVQPVSFNPLVLYANFIKTYGLSDTRYITLHIFNHSSLFLESVFCLLGITFMNEMIQTERSDLGDLFIYTNLTQSTLVQLYKSFHSANVCTMKGKRIGTCLKFKQIKNFDVRSNLLGITAVTVK